MKYVLLLGFYLVSSIAYANEVSIVKVVFIQSGNNWRVDTTLRHNDTGWDHYADEWRVLDASGKELGKRILYHPHEDEQPFTRSLTNLQIPAGVSVVYVEAHDKVDGWSKHKVKVDLGQLSGDRFEVRR